MNNAIFYFFYSFAHKSPATDQAIYFIAQVFPYFVILGAGIFLLFHHHVLPSHNPVSEFLKKWREIGFVFFASGMAWCVAKILKLIIQTPRPFDILANVQSVFVETGYAFPSVHATFFSALAVSIWILHKKAGNIFVFFALAIGIFRIVAGVHFPIDILGGFVLGGGVAYVINRLFGKFAYFSRSV